MLLAWSLVSSWLSRVSSYLPNTSSLDGRRCYCVCCPSWRSCGCAQPDASFSQFPTWHWWVITWTFSFTRFSSLQWVNTYIQLAALVIGSCVTCTDPILSQAIAKGPFADKYVARDLREIISSEAGANDGFGFPFLMLATYLIRYADVPGAGEDHLNTRSEEVGRLGGGVGKALEVWFLETWLYVVLMSIVYGAVCGYGSCKVMKFALKK